MPARLGVASKQYQGHVWIKDVSGKDIPDKDIPKAIPCPNQGYV